MIDPTGMWYLDIGGEFAPVELPGLGGKIGLWGRGSSPLDWQQYQDSNNWGLFGSAIGNIGAGAKIEVSYSPSSIPEKSQASCVEGLFIIYSKEFLCASGNIVPGSDSYRIPLGVGVFAKTTWTNVWTAYEINKWWSSIWNVPKASAASPSQFNGGGSGKGKNKPYI